MADADERDEPEAEDPERSLDFDELHPLVRDAADTAWEREDYPQAIRDAWNALRDLLRQRLGQAGLDGTQLVEAIGETNARLPLTEYVTETDHDMHRGLVLMLRGLVFYVRNPEMHETESPVASDREGAFERLAVMSLCARHVAAAASPAAIEDVVTEASQPLFPRTTEAADELLDSVPRRLRGELAKQLADAARQAWDSEQKDPFAGLAFVFRRLTRVSEEPLGQAAVDACSQLIARDETIQVGTRLLMPSVYRGLPNRHQVKAVRFLATEIKGGLIKSGTVRSGGGALQTVTRMFRAMGNHGRNELVKAGLTALSGSWESQAFGVRFATRIEGFLSRNDHTDLVEAIAQAIAIDNGFDATDELRDAWDDVSDEFQEDMIEALRAREELSREPSTVAHLIERLEAASE